MNFPSLTVPVFTLHTILAWPRSVKRMVVVAMDVALSLIAMWLAFTLRLDTLHWPNDDQRFVYALAPLMSVPIFTRFGLYRAIFRYTGLAALATIAKAVAVYSLLLLCVLWWMQNMQLEEIPRSMGVLQPLIFLFLVAGSRTLARSWLVSVTGQTSRSAARLLIYGAGTAGVQTAAALGSAKQQYQLLGFIDDDPAKVGRSINGVRVHPPSHVPTLVARQKVSDILLALPSATRERRNQIIRALDTVPVHVRTIPGLSDLTSGRVTVQDIRELEIEDLLGREPVPPDTDLLARNLLNKVVLVTGAGGSIGGELCRQILLEKPSQLILLDHNEFGLYSIHSELQSLCANGQLHTALVPLLGSVRDYEHIAGIFQKFRPASVYHAAAYKHVPLVEHNPAEGIANNVFGTLNVARAALENGTERFVLVSTDKAVRPTSIMGASKRIAELILQALAACPSPQFAGYHQCSALDSQAITHSTSFAMVRFGNVLGSSGSVVPIFRRQLAAGGPITVTHEEVTRYFMTIPEAAQLVLQAGAMAEGGDVFVLDMGEPVKIMDLARHIVTLAGLTVRDTLNPEGDIEIRVVGLRPGEKLYEELLIGDNPVPTQHPRIMKAREEFMIWSELSAALDTLVAATQHNNLVAIKTLVNQLVSGCHLDSTQTHIGE
ncbi:polysaccharide biosynthesis protein [Variovorax sp. HJSM1_2]|uniref:polysaccharide biosynthesis protein n=1 Tax=Variovorax sp. HJSM1_2 TaxID=3366263 RepID=UPI003BEB1757